MDWLLSSPPLTPILNQWEAPISSLRWSQGQRAPSLSPTASRRTSCQPFSQARKTSCTPRWARIASQRSWTNASLSTTKTLHLFSITKWTIANFHNKLTLFQMKFRKNPEWGSFAGLSREKLRGIPLGLGLILEGGLRLMLRLKAVVQQVEKEPSNYAYGQISQALRCQKPI